MDITITLGFTVGPCRDSDPRTRGSSIHACSASHLHENFREHEISCINRARRKVFIIYSHKILIIAHSMSVVDTQIGENTNYRRETCA